MSEPPNSQRSATRAPIDRPIRLQFDDSLEVDEGHCINISIGGLYVHTREPRPAGTLVRFELLLDGNQTIRGLGEVAWQQRADIQGKGVGIKFRFLEQRDRQMIFKLVSQHIKARLERENDGVIAAGPIEPRAPEAAAFSTVNQDAMGPEGALPEGALPEGALPLHAAPSGPVGVEQAHSAERMDQTIPMARPVAPVAPVTPASAPPKAIAPEVASPTHRPPSTATDEPVQPSLFDRWEDPPRAEPATGEPVATVSHLDNPAARSTDTLPPSQSAPDAAPNNLDLGDAALGDGAFGDGGLRTTGLGDAVLDDAVLDDASLPGLGLGEEAPASSATSQAVAGTKQIGGARRRRRRDSSGLSTTMWVLLLTIAVAVGGAFLLRDRLFSGLMSGPDARTSAGGGASIDHDPPAVVTGPASTSGQPANAPSVNRDHVPAGGGDGAATEPPSASTPEASSTPTEARRTESTLAEDIADPAAVPSSQRRVPPASVPPAPTEPASLAPILQPVADGLVAAPTVREGHSMTRLLDISWRPSGDQLVVTLVADGTIAAVRVKKFRLAGPTAREVVVLTGMHEPYSRNEMPVGQGGVALVRTGFHAKRQGNEVHVVLDLSDPAKRLIDIRHLGERLELVIGQPMP